MKLITPGIVDIVGQWAGGSPPSGNYVGEVGLADYHDFASVVPEDVQAMIAELTPQVLAGDIETGYVPG
jgi:basic membrane protein A